MMMIKKQIRKTLYITYITQTLYIAYYIQCTETSYDNYYIHTHTIYIMNTTQLLSYHIHYTHFIFCTHRPYISYTDTL